MTDPAAPSVASGGTTYTCPYCRQVSEGTAASCPTCGAPLDIKLRTTTSGWTELPPIVDMARLQLGQSSCQVEGRLVPVAEVHLAPGDAVYFTHDVLLWQEPSVQLEALSFTKPWQRQRSGMPLVMLQATGPGRIAFSHDSPGELAALPLQPGESVDVREHTLLLASAGVSYDWLPTDVWFVTSGEDREGSSGELSLLKAGLEVAGALSGESRDRSRSDQPTWHYPVGQFLDRFHAGERPGLVLTQVAGNAYVRDLSEGESVLVKPPALLFKGPSVTMQLHVEYPAAGVKLWRSWGNRYLWLRLYGPGRVGLQSCYERFDDPGTSFRDLSPHTERLWT